MNPPPTSFQPGQVVQLKSGGPQMVSLGVHPDGFVCCAWFDNATLKQYYFDPAVLATDDQPAPQQPSPLNSLCTSSYCSQQLTFPKHTAADLQMVISSLTGTPISITWLPDPTDPDGIIGWFEVSAPLKS